jgi:hypothetical protein
MIPFEYAHGQQVTYWGPPTDKDNGVTDLLAVWPAVRSTTPAPLGSLSLLIHLSFYSFSLVICGCCLNSRWLKDAIDPQWSCIFSLPTTTFFVLPPSQDYHKVIFKQQQFQLCHLHQEVVLLMLLLLSWMMPIGVSQQYTSMSMSGWMQWHVWSSQHSLH